VLYRQERGRYRQERGPDRLRLARVPAPLVRPDARPVGVVRATADGLVRRAGALVSAAESHARDGRMRDVAARVHAFACNAGV
jgi:hypothetical protein